jgi:hypothetical protein
MLLSDTTRGLELQPRDLDLLRDLFVSRLMTLAQAGAIHFGGKNEMAKKRVQKLKAAGLIGVRVRKAYEPSILFLTRIGFDTIRGRGLLHDLPKLPWASIEPRLKVADLTLRHELDVMDVKAAFFTAARTNASLRIAEFSTWPMLVQFRVSVANGPEMLVKPDGFIRIHEQVGDEVFEDVFFLELDRSTESLETLARRAQAYLAYYQSGGLAERFGHARSEYKDFPFRVLLVFKTAERRNNMAHRLLAGSPPILTQVWASTLKEVVKGSLGPIWIRPRDYRDALGAADRTSGFPSNGTYRRQPDRDKQVDIAARRHTLIGNSTDSACSEQV